MGIGLALFLIPPPTLLEKTDFSKAIYDEHYHLLRLTLSKDDKYRLYTALTKIAPELRAATLLQEDQYFNWHYGVNPIALGKALWQTYFFKSRRMGASTISMQVARIRFHIHSRTIYGKIYQIVRAIQIELHYSKKEILEAYLNLAPYGNNIEGVGAASLIYFGKNAQQLSLPEALTLAVMPQNPNQRTPNQKNLKNIRNKLFARWIEQHPEDKYKNSIINLPLQLQTIHALPFIAPHFVNTLLTIQENEIVTTLDIKLQKILENVMHRYVSRKKQLGVSNCALLLVDTRDIGVKAWVGSANFFDTSIQGQINGVDVKRSPGSTLKPFIYALALDQGLIHPLTVLKDVPSSFGNYNPENFDYDFMGPISATDALHLSRNVPAISLAAQLKQPNLYQLLQEAHVTHLKSESFYGLSLALGGAEVSMRELVGLYTMLMNNGAWRPLRFYKNETLIQEKKLISPEASFLVLEMLKEKHRTEFNSGSSALSVSWKTGTSSGFRDAWTIGTFGPYVLGVWIGNFNNHSNPTFVGKNIAAPLFFELVSAINKEAGPLPKLEKNLEQLHLIRLPVCKASGLLPTRFCKNTEETWFIPGKSPIQSDTIFREVAIDKNSGLRTCRIDKKTQFETFEFWSSDLLKIFNEARMKRRVPPPFDDSCKQPHQNGLIPQIISPKTHLDYVIRGNSSIETQIPFYAVTDAEVVNLYWFVNETFLGKIAHDQHFLWTAKPGKFVIRVVDDHGRANARDLLVRVEK